MKCRKCGSENMGIMPNKKNSSATDLYCLDCGAWQKFATKDEIRLYQCKKKPITNADRIRQMTDEELAELLITADFCGECEYCDKVWGCRYYEAHPDGALNDGCKQAAINWLGQPAEEDT